MFAFRFQVPFIPPRTLTAVALCLALLAVGCNKKPARITPAVLVPSIESEPQPAPPSHNPPDENANTVPETVPADTPQRDAQKPKPRRPIPHRPQPPVTEAAKPEPAKPSTPDNSVQITADVPRAAVQSQKQNTEQLLRNSEGKITHIYRNLSESEQGMMRQARNYITQSNQALQGGDIERAYNLAVKANLLANELAK
jgi:outer membrane biosynthesis protein TonB